MRRTSEKVDRPIANMSLKKKKVKAIKMVRDVRIGRRRRQEGQCTKRLNHSHDQTDKQASSYNQQT